MNMTERGFIPAEAIVDGLSAEKSVEKTFDDLHLSLVGDAIEEARVNNSAMSSVDIVRKLVSEQKIVYADLERLIQEIDKKVEDHSYFDELTGEQIEAVKAIQEYLDASAPGVFGSGVLGKEIDNDVDPGTKTFGSNVLGQELDRGEGGDKNNDSAFDLDEAA